AIARVVGPTRALRQDAGAGPRRSGSPPGLSGADGRTILALRARPRAAMPPGPGARRRFLLGGGFMFRLDLGPARNYCDGLSRRTSRTLGVAGMASVGLPELSRARSLASGAATPTRDTAVILLWLDGGPSHMDLYDLKPDAPAEYRGIWRPIPTMVPGFQISE